MNLKQIATSERTFIRMACNMGIALYSRFSEDAGAKFLSISPQSLTLIRGQGKISFIQLDSNKVEYFGYQLLEYLLGAVCQTANPKKNSQQVLTGLLDVKKF